MVMHCWREQRHAVQCAVQGLRGKRAAGQKVEATNRLAAKGQGTNRQHSGATYGAL